MNNHGMGNPHEEQYYYTGYRDAGQSEKTPLDKVYDPLCDPARMNPERYKEIEQFLCMFKDKLTLGCGVYPVKRPAFVEPPFFSKPLIKTGRRSVAPSTEVELLTFTIGDRHRIIVTSVGLDTDSPQILTAQNLKFWFAVDRTIVPIFDDQSPAANFAIPAAQPTFGQTTIFPGSTQSPFSLRKAGLTFMVRGPATLTFNVLNSDLVTTVEVTPLFTFYEYWLQKSGEFEKGDIQV